MPSLKALTTEAGMVVATMMCADSVINEKDVEGTFVEAYRKICSWIAKKFGISPPDLKPLLKTKLDAISVKLSTFLSC